MNSLSLAPIRTLVAYRQSNFENYKKAIFGYDGNGSISLSEENGTTIFSSPLTQVKSQSTSKFFIVWLNGNQYNISPLIALAGQGAMTKKDVVMLGLTGGYYGISDKVKVANIKAQQEAYLKDKEYYDDQIKQWSLILSSGGAKRRSTKQFAITMLSIFFIILFLIVFASRAMYS